ncbi:DUF2530 domain-containing protein [Nocardiopsis coralliicola]
MRAARRPDPEVLEFDYRIPTALGTAGWTAALVVLLVQGTADRWWIWVCAVGIALGVFAYAYIPYLLGKREAAEAARDAEHAGAERAEDPSGA